MKLNSFFEERKEKKKKEELFWSFEASIWVLCKDFSILLYGRVGICGGYILHYLDKFGFFLFFLFFSTYNHALWSRHVICLGLWHIFLKRKMPMTPCQNWTIISVLMTFCCLWQSMKHIEYLCLYWQMTDTLNKIKKLCMNWHI